MANTIINIIIGLYITAHLYIVWLIIQAYEADRIKTRKRRKRRR